MSNDSSINEDNVEQLVSAIKAGAIIDPRADHKYSELLDHPKIIDALKKRYLAEVGR